MQIARVWDTQTIALHELWVWDTQYIPNIILVSGECRDTSLSFSLCMCIECETLNTSTNIILEVSGECRELSHAKG